MNYPRTTIILCSLFISHLTTHLLAHPHHVKISSDLEIEIETDSSKTYFLQESDNLVNWKLAGTYTIGNGVIMQEGYDTSKEGRYFYRYSIYPTNFSDPHDTDGDSLSNQWELENDLNPVDSDEDGNFIMDGLDDFDGDGISNGEEELGGSSPNTPDYGLRNVEFTNTGNALITWPDANAALYNDSSLLGWEAATTSQSRIEIHTIDGLNFVELYGNWPPGGGSSYSVSRGLKQSFKMEAGSELTYILWTKGKEHLGNAFHPISGAKLTHDNNFSVSATGATLTVDGGTNFNFTADPDVDKFHLVQLQAPAATPIAGVNPPPVDVELFFIPLQTQDHFTVGPRIKFLPVTVEEVIEEGEVARSTGYDKDENALMVPMEGSNKIKVKIKDAPPELLAEIKFVSLPADKLTIAPEVPTVAEQELSLSGTAAHLAVDVQLEIDGNKAKLFEADVLKRIEKTMEIHQIVDENDDVQAVDHGVNAGANVVCITAGANNFIDSVPGNDDTIVGNTITTGADGICDTFARDRDTLFPRHVPTAMEVQDYFNKRVWGNQANVFFTITRTDHAVNYDLDKNRKLGDPHGRLSDTPPIPPRPNEINAINASPARRADVNYNFYIVDRVDIPFAIAQRVINAAFSQEVDADDNIIIEHVMAHETGHLIDTIGEAHETGGADYIMSSPTDGSQVSREFWRRVNP